MRHPTDRWTREELVERVLTPLREGKTVTQVAEECGVKRNRIYCLLKQFGFNNKREVLEDVQYT